MTTPRRVTRSRFEPTRPHSSTMHPRAAFVNALIGQLDLDAPRDPRRELLHREIKRSMIIFSWATALDFAFGRVAPHAD